MNQTNQEAEMGMLHQVPMRDEDWAGIAEPQGADEVNVIEIEVGPEAATVDVDRRAW